MRVQPIDQLQHKYRAALEGTERWGSAHPVFPYLLRTLTVDRPNQVWAADITYIPMARGFVFLVAVMDWATRKVLAWRVSTTLTSDCCVAALEEALARFGQQIVAILQEHQGGVTAKEIIRRHGIALDTFYRWRRKYGGLEVSDARRLHQLEDENRRLKHPVAEQVLQTRCLRT